MRVRGTTGTGLDQVIELITRDHGLKTNAPGRDIAAGARAADQINKLIVDGIKATGVANDGTLNTADLRDINAWIRADATRLQQFIDAHGNDEDGLETGFHLVQNDGGRDYIFGDQKTVDTVLDGLYHIGFGLKGDRFANEDGNANARIADAALWLTQFLKADLAGTGLRNGDIDLNLTDELTGTGLDAVTRAILADDGLNSRIQTSEIIAGARAANGINQLILQAIQATDAARDGVLNEADVREINAWIRADAGRLATFTALHGDDEEGVETGFHLVQDDGALSLNPGDWRNLIDTVADGIYHIGFEISGGRFKNEDGNANASLREVATWLNQYLGAELSSGVLVGADQPVNLDAPVLRIDREILVANNQGHLDVAHSAAQAVATGTVALTFQADAPGDNTRDVLFSKDAQGNGNGHMTAWVQDGRLIVRLQDASREIFLTSCDIPITDATKYTMAVKFGAEGSALYLNGVTVDSNADFKVGWQGNDNRLTIGANNWDSTPQRPTTADHFEGRIQDFQLFDRALNGSEILALADAAGVQSPVRFAAALAGGMPAAPAGTGLRLKAFDSAGDIRDLAALDRLMVSQAATAEARVARVDFADRSGNDTLVKFLGDAILDQPTADPGFETIGLSLEGWIYIPRGVHTLTVTSDDGFRLKLGGTDFMAFVGQRGMSSTTRTAEFEGGLYQVKLDYFENKGRQGLTLAMDGRIVDGGHFFASQTDYLQALQTHGELPAGQVAQGTVEGTTGTGLDLALDLIQADQGLLSRISLAEIRDGAEAADVMNQILVDAIRATGAANDGRLTGADIRDMSLWIQRNAAQAWTEAHGNDEGAVETGFHKVQGDGGRDLIFTDLKTVDTVLDGIYHIGFPVKGHRTANEDGNANASLGDVARWLNQFLAEDLKGTGLRNGAVDTTVTDELTGTGMDRLTRIILNEEDLQQRIATSEQLEGARAANALNQLIVQGIIEMDLVGDGDFTASDAYDVSAWIREDSVRKQTFIDLHGNDEGNTETGFHLVQNDGARTTLFGQNAVDTIADGIYHIGFETRNGWFLNEDGNQNARVVDVAHWIETLLAADIAAGTLSSGNGRDLPISDDLI